MTKKILWIDDDFYAIQGLLRPIQKEGYKVDVALSALDGYRKAQHWKDYDLIVVDLILPISQEETAPDIVKSWDSQEKYRFVGLGLINWLLKELQAKCPVMILSVVANPISTYGLEHLGLAGCIRKSGLLPLELKEELIKAINSPKKGDDEV
jgi:CheY-like chemotaxis protein